MGSEQRPGDDVVLAAMGRRRQLEADARIGRVVRASMSTLRAGRPDVDWLDQFDAFAKDNPDTPIAILLSSIVMILRVEASDV